MPFTTSDPFHAASFSIFRRSMIQQDDLPLADVLEAPYLAEAFEEQGVDFGRDEQAVYSPAITVWALISQVFFSGEQRSCKAAVMRVAALWAALGRRVCDTNTGAYCRARAKIPAALLRCLVKRIAEGAEAEVFDGDAVSPEKAQAAKTPPVVAAVKSRPRRGRILLVDGCTITAADTQANQAEYPQNSAQEEGLGFPILRCVGVISLVTGLLVDWACGPFCGKATGETALLRQLLDELEPGDVLVADSYYCTYWLMAACRARGVEVVMKNHHKRNDHPRGARKLGRGERLVVWSRPPRPQWMSEEDYQRQPESVAMRLVDVTVARPGYRATSFCVATTILENDVYTRAWISSVYNSRWIVELDLRSLKCSLGIDILRAKSPEMVRTELWSCLLAYNLIRLKMLQSCAERGRDPRSVSFATTQQLLATTWLLCAVIGTTAELARLGQTAPCSQRIGHRDGRVEPRAIKRRPQYIALLDIPRHQARVELGAPA